MVKAKYARFSGPVFRGMILIVMLYAFIALLAGLLYGGKWGTAAVVFVVSSLVLRAKIPKPPERSAIAGEGTVPDWYIAAYCIVIGLGFDWACAVLWFSRRFALFSAPVLGVTGLIVALYAAIGLLVARLTGGELRLALVVFALASWILCGNLDWWLALHR